jgi:hypothetical protein
MADGAKIALSQEELQLLRNKEWILTKRALVQRADALLGAAVPGLQALVQAHPWLPPEVAASNPKIHRGENYRGLPYLLLDYPAAFGKGGSMALRTMLWWGHFFSVTLHLSGRYKTVFQETLLQRVAELQRPGLYLCTGAAEWEHHFDGDNYTETTDLHLQQLQDNIADKDFVKLATRFDLGQWTDIPVLTVRQVGQLLALIEPPSYPSGGTNP